MSTLAVVPVIDGEGHVTEVYGRKILGKRLRKGTPQHLYLPCSHQGVWNATALADSEEVILCEALIDAMTFWVNGYRNVTASYGTSGFIDDHTLAFKQAKIKRVLIAYDRDEAGNTATVKLADQLQAGGFACYRLNFPKDMDANTYALEVTPASKSMGVVIRSAEWMGDGEAPERNQEPPTAPEISPALSSLAADLQSQKETTELKPTAPGRSHRRYPPPQYHRHQRTRSNPKSPNTRSISTTASAITASVACKRTPATR